MKTVDFSNRQTIKSILSGIFLIILLFLFFTLPITKLIGKTNLSFETLFFMSRLKIWFCLFLIYLYTKFIEKKDFFLWSEKKYSIPNYLKSIISVLGVLVGVMLVVGIILKLTGLFVESQKMKEIIAVLNKNKILLVFTCLTAGFTEEFIFRGYLMPRISLLFKNAAFPIVLSSLFFGLMHFGYETIAQVVGPFAIGLIFAIHYYKYRSLTILIICHFLWDFVSILIKSRAH